MSSGKFSGLNPFPSRPLPPSRPKGPSLPLPGKGVSRGGLPLPLRERDSMHGKETWSRMNLCRLLILLAAMWALFFPICLSQDRDNFLGFVSRFEAQLNQKMQRDGESIADSDPIVTTETEMITQQSEEEDAHAPPLGLMPPVASPPPPPSILWQPWSMHQSLLHYFPTSEASTLDPGRFQLHFKVLTFDRVEVAQRFLDSLSRVEFMGDTATLEIFIDHPHTTYREWSHKTAQERVDAMAAYRNMLECVNRFSWPHGPKSIHARVGNAGVQPQWVEAWWPQSVNDFAFVAEDDMEVSPLLYIYFKRLMMFYYYNQTNFDPSVFGLSVFRQRQVAGINGSRYKQPAEPFLYPLVGTWGQFLFPLGWKDFRMWYNENRFAGLVDPTIGKMITVKWWRRAGNHIWTPWHIRWAFVRNRYNMYSGFPGHLALARSHRTAGVSFRKTMGPDAELINCQNMFEEQKEEPWQRLPGGGKRRWPQPDHALTPREVADLGEKELPDWWVATPGPESIQKFDWCFRRVPNRRTPMRSFQELAEELGHCAPQDPIAVVPLLSSKETYALIKNWLCFVDGLGLRNFVLLLTLLPTRTSPQVDPTAAPACSQSAFLANGEAWRISQDLAARGHLVYLADPTSDAFLTQHECVGPTALKARSASSSLLSLNQAQVVRGILGLGRGVLVNTPGALWMGNPFKCVPFALAARAEGAGLPLTSWGLKTGEGGKGGGMGSLVVWIRRGEEGVAAVDRVIKTMETLGISDLGLLQEENLGEVKSTLNLELAEEGKALPGSCVTASVPPTNNSAHKIVLVRNEALPLKRLSLWNVDDLHFACLELNCKRSYP